jgi:hypothetical protein
MRPGENTVGTGKPWIAPLPAGVTGVTADVPGGYNAEIKIPFSALGISTPAELQFIGIDVNAGDDDGLNNGVISRKLLWNSLAYLTPYTFGLAQLTGTNKPSNPDLGFENDFTSWSIYSGAAGVTLPTINSPDARPGSTGTKTAYVANGGASYVLTGLTANTTYSLKAWVKAVNGQDIWVVVSDFGGSGNNPGQKMTATTWTQTGDIVFKTGANNTSVTLSAWTGSGSAAYFDAFTVVAYTPTVTADRTDNPGTGKVTARSDYAGNRVDAFDNNSSTAWLDYSTTSWIQFEFDNSAKYAVSSYTITSNPFSRHFDAKDWKLYGTNTPEVAFPSGYTELNAQSGMLFTASEKKTFNISNTTGYRAYRLEITANSGGPAIQISEMELFAPASCSTCRVASAEVESLSLKLYPNPASSEVSIDLSGFAGESAVQVKMSDMSGKLFVGQQVQLGEGVKQVTLPVSHLPQGLFFVTVQGSKASKTAKLIITK